MMVPFNFPTKIWKGNITIITPAISIPGQPNRVINIAIIPANTKGEINEAKKIGDFV
jgi:hypothetical protein